MGVDTNDGDPSLISGGDDSGFVGHDDFVCFDGETGGVVGFEVFNGIEADGGDIESHVLFWLGDFEQCPCTTFAEFACAFDHFVCAFDGFDGDNFTISNRNTLTYVEVAHTGDDGECEIDVFAMLWSGLSACHDTCVCELIGDVFGGVDECDSVGFEFISNSGKDGIVAFIMSEFTKPEANCTEVGELFEEVEGIVHAYFFDTAYHDNFVGTPFSHEADPFTKLHDACGFEMITKVREGGVILCIQPDTGNWMTRVTDTLCGKDGELSFTRDEAYGGLGGC